MDQGDGEQVEWLNTLVESIRWFHEAMLEIGGGLPGEHTASLYAACARPFHTAFGRAVYTTSYERAAALFHAIICDHVFVDGNKRTGTIAAMFLLAAEDALPEFGTEESLRLALLGQVALDTARGELTVDQVTFWIRRIFELNGPTSAA